ncbi:M24 family metallopeptidase [Colibacter massiliensis]|uniref:M24 family metallopeptidase n=1 Tax=Colibacter massiliensis TaxID=1852379 RepID=UPI003F90C7C5
MIDERIRALRRFLKERHVESVLLLQPENLRYFSGFTGGEGALVVTPEEAVLWTDLRYTEQAVQECDPSVRIENHGGRLPLAAAGLLAEGAGVVGYEKNYMTHAFYEALAQEELSFEGLSVTALRAVKEPYELEATRKASAIADKAFADVLAYIEPGVTERELAARLESNMLLGGAEGKSFDTIVASGKRSAMPHGTATDKVVEKGDFITFDFGALWDGYHSDMTRTVVVGKASNEQKKVYELVLEAQLLGAEAVKAGVVCSEVDGIVRKFFEDRECAQYFTHALGHGTGLEIHEEPLLSPRAQGVLQENMIVTVEPGLYKQGLYGVRIEDSLIVTKTGHEIVTKTSKELMELL